MGKIFNGPANGADVATALFIDSEDNIYVTGSSTGIGTGLDIATIKYNSAGAEQWIQRYNGSANSSDLARAITIDNNSNIYVTGSSFVTANNTDLITIKYNSNGIQQWVRNYDGPGEGGSIAADQNGNIYVGGKSELSLATVKYDSTGELQWVQRYSNPDGDTRFSKMVIDNQANVYVTGGRSFSGLSNFLTIKYDTDGNQQWLQTYWGPDNSYEESVAIAIDDQKNIYITGYSDSNFVTNYATIKYSQEKEKRYPVFIVPGIAGTFAGNNNYIQGWLLNRGIHPDSIQVDPLGRVYDDLISTLENVGYVKNKDLFIVNYDWRLTPGPVDNNIDGFIEGLSGVSISDNQFDYAVDYLGWYIKRAADQWRADHNEELDSIDVITHSTGGLVARTYIQSDAYGDIYDSGNDYRLPKIRNFVMIGVPNRGASKAWNQLRDNWIADIAYRMVLSKIINLAFQQVKSGKTITGPDYNINLSSIQDSLGNANKELFIYKYVPTIRYLLATFNFIDFGNGLTNVNDDPEIRNTIILDLNNGFDIDPLNDPNGFLDSAKVSVIYGVGQSTASVVNLRSDFEFNAKQSFTDWTPRNALPGEYWYKDISPENIGDGTVPTISSAGQFLIDTRAQLFPFSEGDHTGLVTKKPVQSTILNLFEVDYLDSQIKTGTGANIKKVLSVLLDPAELIITDGNGNRLGYSNSTGALTEIENSVWFGNNDGVGYVFGSVTEPINLQVTGLGQEFYVMVSIEDSGKYGGVVLEGFLAQGEVINYQITFDPINLDSTFQLSVNVEDGWNMVSVPGLHPVDQNVNTWWMDRNPSAQVFRFDGGYQSVTNTSPGEGYWMKHIGSRVYNTGDEWPASGITVAPNNPISANAGWNLIGGYDLSIPISSITTTPPGLQQGLVYGYSSTSGYSITDNLVPGYAYWINLSAPAQINIPASVNKNTIGMSNYINEEWGRIIITDNAGKKYTLYGVTGGVNLNNYLLPPQPPAEMFDVRYSSGRYAEDLYSSAQLVEMTGVEYPVTIRVENLSIRIEDETGKKLNSVLKSGEEIVINESSLSRIKVMAEGEVITQYSLSQNYPNPFNPSTKITFVIPNGERNLVTLKVYDILGNEVATLVNEYREAGRYEVTFDASNLASGMYLYRLQAGSYIETKKMIYIK